MHHHSEHGRWLSARAVAAGEDASILCCTLRAHPSCNSSVSMLSAARTMTSHPSGPESVHLYSQEPDGENEVWDSATAALRSPDPSAAQGFGMTEPASSDQHIPLEQYR